MKSRIHTVLQFSLAVAAVFLSMSSNSVGREKDRNIYRLEGSSKLWINGSATIGSYECKTAGVYGRGDLGQGDKAANENREPASADKGAKVEVLVKLFDCGNPAMNRDMFNALKADRDSLIIYELRNASVTYDSTRYNGSFGLRTVGKLTIAGKTREDTIYTSVKMLPDRRYEIVGEKSISMLDFDIDPPSAFFGLIRANENLIVKFDLLASPQYEDIIGEND